MEARSKWLWTVTVANVAFAALLLLVIYNIMLALAVLAPEISGWPLYVLLPIGLALSVTGLRFTKGVASRALRRGASVLNGCALALDLLVVLGLATMFFGSTKERFLIPDGYKGDVFVVYSAQDGAVLNKSRGEVTYRIPEDGILRTREPMPRGSTRTEYYYLRQDSSLELIETSGPLQFIRLPKIWRMTKT